MGKQRIESDSETVTHDDVKVRHPKNYQVILINDNFSTMDFVVAVLESIFNKSPAEAVQIMMRVHKLGRGVAGVFSRQIAEAKIALVHERATQTGHPLRCTMEEA